MSKGKTGNKEERGQREETIRKQITKEKSANKEIHCKDESSTRQKQWQQGVWGKAGVDEESEMKDYSAIVTLHSYCLQKTIMAHSVCDAVMCKELCECVSTPRGLFALQEMVGVRRERVRDHEQHAKKQQYAVVHQL